jgi:hypothetical protein
MSDELQRLGLFDNNKKVADYPESEQSDYFRGLATIPISLIPTGTAVLDLVFKAPISKRKDEWAKELGEKVQWLLDNGLTVEELQHNERFVDVVFQATQIAVKTSQKEKIEALKNVVVNIANGVSNDESLNQLFINLIEELSVTHLQMLKIIDKPQDTAEKLNVQLSAVELLDITALCGKLLPNLRKENIKLFWNDLIQKGLTFWVGNNPPETTEFGKEFLNFITEK